jgi:1-aminocyclopropane-1-carboxylate deaminase/D-cysteine desulfhydrase-like pyridoxal-dependent ACC family enzyme
MTTVASIDDAIDAVQDYIDDLQAVQSAAANAGNMVVVTTIGSYYKFAQYLENELASLKIISEADSLQAAVNAVKQTTQQLAQQKQQIDNIVAAVGTAAMIAGVIDEVVTAVGKL